MAVSNNSAYSVSGEGIPCVPHSYHLPLYGKCLQMPAVCMNVSCVARALCARREQVSIFSCHWGLMCFAALRNCWKSSAKPQDSMR